MADQRHALSAKRRPADNANAGTLYAFMTVDIARTIFFSLDLPLDAMLVLPIWGLIGLGLHYACSRRSHRGRGIVENHEVEAVTEIEPIASLTALRSNDAAGALSPELARLRTVRS
jgi:hypothetical protein